MSGVVTSHPVWHLGAGVAIAMAVAVAPAAWAHYRMSRVGRGTLRQRPTRLAQAIAAGALLAAAVHVSVCPEHFRESLLFGSFFVVTSLLQVAWAVMLLGRAPSPRLLQLGAFGQAAVAWLWVVSRTVGVPLGPQPWRPEAVGLTGAIATAIEVAVAIAAMWLAVHDDRLHRAGEGPQDSPEARVHGIRPAG